MTTLQYEDSGCRQKQIQKEKDEFAIGFAEWLLVNDTPENAEIWFGHTYKDMLNAYKTEKNYEKVF